jgi:MbtH protein
MQSFVADQEGAGLKTTVENDDVAIYKVVVNQEEQYSIWPEDKDVPAGWKEIGKRGVKSECLSAIREIWTDMRPLSQRERDKAKRTLVCG